MLEPDVWAVGGSILVWSVFESKWEQPETEDCSFWLACDICGGVEQSSSVDSFAGTLPLVVMKLSVCVSLPTILSGPRGLLASVSSPPPNKKSFTLFALPSKLVSLEANVCSGAKFTDEMVPAPTTRRPEDVDVLALSLSLSVDRASEESHSSLPSLLLPRLQTKV